MKSRAILASAVGILILAGCGTKTIVVERPAETTEAPEITSAPSSSIGEQAYINTISDEYPGIMKSMGKKWVLDFGYLVCEQIDNGMTFNELLQMTIETGTDATQIGFLTGAAIVTLCPENKWFIETLN
jgi:hypothetical protein